MNKRTAAIVIHVTPELKARLHAAAEARGLKLSPYCFAQLKTAEDARLAFAKDVFAKAMAPLEAGDQAMGGERK